MCFLLEKVEVVNNQNKALFSPLSLSLKAGEIACLMGPSGCGKSSLLSLIAGHLSKDFTYRGQVILNGSVLNELPAYKRGVGILFQEDLLFPHLNVLENLAFAIPSQYNKKERIAMSADALKAIDLAKLANAYPHQLSGGQSARISLMRLLLAEPKLVLLDEPFSKLDKRLRTQFRNWVFSKLCQANLPTLMVTHDETDIPEGAKVVQWPWQLTEKELKTC